VKKVLCVSVIFLLLPFIFSGCIFRKEEKTPPTTEKETEESYLGLINSLRNEIAVNPDDPEKRYKLAQAYYYVEKYDEALRELDRAIELSEGDRAMLSKIYTLKAGIYRDQSDKEAENTYQSAIRENPKNIMAYINLSVLFRSRREYGKAVQILEQGLEKNPKSKDLYLHLARTYNDKGDTYLAKEAYRKVLELDPGNNEAKDGAR